MKRRWSILRILIFYGTALLLILLFIGPILWMVSLSFKTRTEIFAYPPRLLPETFSFANYLHVLTNSRIPLYLYNSFMITVFAVVGNLLVTIPAAFAFSRYRFMFKNQFLFLILMFQMISPLIISIPLYRYFVLLGLLNSHPGLILIYITIQIPFAVWLLKGFFDSVPLELDQAAIIDGCTEFQTLLRIILPISVPGIATVLVFNTVNSWGQLIIPLIFLNNIQLYPISVGILHFADAQTEGEVTTHFMAVASVMGLLPAVVIITGLQKFIVRVLTAGSIKE
jgi:multiple sugar transport system permease protein